MAINQTPSNYLLDSSKEYSIYVCSSRAIPAVTDGMKDVQRKSLWVMKNQVAKIKTVAVVGKLMESGLYTHGDASAADAISMLAAPYCNNVTLISPKGNFGSRVKPTGWGAARYTSVYRSKAAESFFYNDLDIVPLKDNYDGSTKEPITFLPIIPTVLLNGISGIAVGWSTEILPRKLEDLINAVEKTLEGKRFNRLKPHYSYLNIDVLHLEDNSWEFIGKATVKDASTILVTELTPDLSLSKFRDRLDTMEENGQIKGYSDRSTKHINVEVRLGRGECKGWTDQKCIDFLKLRQKKTERIVAIDWNGESIRQYSSAEELIRDFVEWRVKWYYIRYQTLLDKAEHELKYWKGLKLCFDKKLPKLLGNGIASKAEIEEKVITMTKSLSLDSDHIDKIVNLSTFRWADDYYQVVLEKIKELEDSISDYKIMLSDDKYIRAQYLDELKDLKAKKF